MNTFLTDVRGAIIPDPDGAHGPLPPLLLSMTLVTGLVDSFSYLVLGHVFVANMTGNVVFLGFALIGAVGFSITASVVALASFAAGALIGGKMASEFGGHRGRLLSSAAALESVLLAVAVVLAALSGSPVSGAYRYALIVLLSVSLGVQNAAARKIAVPDLTTTVLTLTITGITADSALAGGRGSRAGRRLTAVVAMLAGALIGAALVLHARIYYPLGLAFLAILPIALMARTLGKSQRAWAHAPG
jgi:uncharacterized membrane protein YoaK (UPF0700 family)